MATVEGLRSLLEQSQGSWCQGSGTRKALRERIEERSMDIIELRRKLAAG